jgi:hypothetical protein
MRRRLILTALTSLTLVMAACGDTPIPADAPRLSATEAATTVATTIPTATDVVTTTEVPDDPEDPVAERLEAARLEALEALRERITHPDRNPSEGVIVRLSVTGGWELQDDTVAHMTIEDDGRVVRVGDTSVFSSTDDYTSMRLSETGVQRVVERVADIVAAPAGSLDGGAAVSPTDRSAVIEVGGQRLASMDRIGARDGYSASQQEWRGVFDAIIADLHDLSWLGNDILEDEAPWIPDSMTVLAGDVSARSGLDPNAPFMAWPLDRSITQLSESTTRNPYDEEELVICLVGVDVELVFALLTGVNHAYLRVDDGTRWELNVTPHYPGYRLLTDPCP